MTIGIADAPPKHFDKLGLLLEYVKNNIDNSPDKVFKVKVKDLIALTGMDNITLSTACWYIRLFVSNRGILVNSKDSRVTSEPDEITFSYPKEIKPIYKMMGFESQKDYEDYMSGCKTIGANLCSELKNKHEKNKNNPDSLFYRSSFLKGLTGCDSKDDKQENEQ